MERSQHIPNIEEDLDRPHNVTLTEGEIGVILCTLETLIDGYKDYKTECLVVREIDSIFEKLEGIVDNYYNKQIRNEQRNVWQLNNLHTIGWNRPLMTYNKRVTNKDQPYANKR